MTGRIFLGAIAMVGVQCLFGLASELLPFTSASGLIALSTFGCFFAAAVGGLIAKRGFAISAALVLLLDWLLIIYVLAGSAQPPKDHSAIIAATWPLIIATLVVAVVGAKAGEWVGSKRSPSSDSATT